MLPRPICAVVLLWLAGCHDLAGYHQGLRDGAPPDRATAPADGAAEALPDAPGDAPADGRDDLRAGDAAIDGSTTDGPTTDGPTTDGSTTDGPTTDGPYDGAPADSATADLRADLTTDTRPPDGASDDGGCAASRVVITEMMIDPKAQDPDGEWFELFNASAATIDLSGWYLVDQDLVVFTIPGSGLQIGPGQYIVLCADGVDPVVPCRGQPYSNGQPCDVNICFNNAGDYLELYDDQSTLVDRVEYTGAWPFASGASMSLIDQCLDNGMANSWCQETTIYGGSGNNKGTPGDPASCP